MGVHWDWKRNGDADEEGGIGNENEGTRVDFVHVCFCMIVCLSSRS